MSSFDDVVSSLPVILGAASRYGIASLTLPLLFSQAEIFTLTSKMKQGAPRQIMQDRVRSILEKTKNALDNITLQSHSLHGLREICFCIPIMPSGAADELPRLACTVPLPPGLAKIKALFATAFQES